MMMCDFKRVLGGYTVPIGRDVHILTFRIMSDRVTHCARREFLIFWWVFGGFFVC